MHGGLGATEGNYPYGYANLTKTTETKKREAKDEHWQDKGRARDQKVQASGVGGDVVL